MSTINSSSDIFHILGIKDTKMTPLFAWKLDTMLRFVKNKELTTDEEVEIYMNKKGFTNLIGISRRLIKDGMIEGNEVELVTTGEGEDKLKEFGYTGELIINYIMKLCIAISACGGVIALIRVL